MGRPIRWAAVPALALALVAGGAYGPVPDAVPTTMTLTWPANLTVPDPCADPSEQPFTPTAIDIPGVGVGIQVLPLPRDENDVPGTPPNDDPTRVAFDKPPGIPLGAPRGTSILNAHTWPDGRALGNAMLTHTRPGDVFYLTDGTHHRCYRVVKQLHLPDDVVPPGFYSRTGPHQIAFMVCSGTRLGPGNWDHRETWYADPIDASPTT